MSRWIALLRGINVGGANKLPMADLRASVESLAYRNVSTHIQSGNIFFEADDAEGEIASKIRNLLQERHDLSVPVVVRPQMDIVKALAGHPDAGGDIDPKLLHVAFLDRAPDDPGGDENTWLPDRWALSGRDLYLTYPEGSARSKMTIDKFEKAWEVTATARNLNTIAKLADLTDSG